MASRHHPSHPSNYSRIPATSRSSTRTTSAPHNIHSQPGDLSQHYPSTSRRAGGASSHLAPRHARRPPADTALRRPRTAASSATTVSANDGGTSDREHHASNARAGDRDSGLRAVSEEVDIAEDEDDPILCPVRDQPDMDMVFGSFEEMDLSAEDAEDDASSRRRANAKLIEMYRSHSRQHLDPQDLKAAVQASLNEIVASLDDDKWMYEPEPQADLGM